MKISVILTSILVAQVSASFFDVFHGAVLSVQNSFGKLLSDVVTDVKDTVDCTILAVEQVLSLSNDATTRYYDKCGSGTNKTEASTETPNASSLPKVEATLEIADKEEYLQKEIPAEIDAKINETLSKFLGNYNPREDLLSIENVLVKESGKLADVSQLVKQELEKLSNEVTADLKNLEERETGPSVDSILKQIKVLENREHNTNDTSEANKIHRAIDEVLGKLGRIEATEATENTKLELILNDLENNSNSTFVGLRKQFEEWKEEESRHLGEIKIKIDEHENIVEQLGDLHSKYELNQSATVLSNNQNDNSTNVDTIIISTPFANTENEFVSGKNHVTESTATTTNSGLPILSTNISNSVSGNYLNVTVNNITYPITGSAPLNEKAISFDTTNLVLLNINYSNETVIENNYLSRAESNTEFEEKSLNFNTNNDTVIEEKLETYLTSTQNSLNNSNDNSNTGVITDVSVFDDINSENIESLNSTANNQNESNVTVIPFTDSPVDINTENEESLPTKTTIRNESFDIITTFANQNSAKTFEVNPTLETVATIADEKALFKTLEILMNASKIAPNNDFNDTITSVASSANSSASDNVQFEEKTTDSTRLTSQPSNTLASNHTYESNATSTIPVLMENPPISDSSDEPIENTTTDIQYSTFDTKFPLEENIETTTRFVNAENTVVCDISQSSTCKDDQPTILSTFDPGYDSKSDTKVENNSNGKVSIPSMGTASPPETKAFQPLVVKAATENQQATTTAQSISNYVVMVNESKEKYPLSATVLPVESEIISNNEEIAKLPTPAIQMIPSNSGKLNSNDINHIETMSPPFRNMASLVLPFVPEPILVHEPISLTSRSPHDINQNNIVHNNANEAPRINSSINISQPSGDRILKSKKSFINHRNAQEATVNEKPGVPTQQPYSPALPNYYDTSETQDSISNRFLVTETPFPINSVLTTPTPFIRDAKMSAPGSQFPNTSDQQDRSEIEAREKAAFVALDTINAQILDSNSPFDISDIIAKFADITTTVPREPKSTKLNPLFLRTPRNQFRPLHSFGVPFVNPGLPTGLTTHRPMKSHRRVNNNKPASTVDYDSFFHMPQKNSEVHERALKEARQLIEHSRVSDRIINNIMKNKNNYGAKSVFSKQQP